MNEGASWRTHDAAAYVTLHWPRPGQPALASWVSERLTACLVHCSRLSPSGYGQAIRDVNDWYTVPKFAGKVLDSFTFFNMQERRFPRPLKRSVPSPRIDGYHAKFGIPMAQLARTDSPPGTEQDFGVSIEQQDGDTQEGRARH